MERRILALGRALRGSGAPVSTPEIIDAERAALAVGVRRRGDLRVALRACLVKRTEDVPAFSEHFERLFPAGVPRPSRRRGAGRERERAAVGGKPTADSGGRARAIGSGATSEGKAAERPHSERREGEERIPRNECDGATTEAPSQQPAADTARADLGSSAAREDDEAGVGEPKESQASAARRRLLAKGFRERWSSSEEREATAAMEDLAGRLVTRLALRRHRSKRGTLDMPGTLRANLRHGGIPFILRKRRRIAGRRDLVLLADVSGSVRRAAALFLLIIGRLRGRFSGVRAFAYVDRPVEIPASLALRPATEIGGALAASLPLDALSDHGETLRRFNRDFYSAVGGRSVVIVLGDARNNRFPAQEWELEAIRRRCRRLVWIVPEPPSLWGSGDSAIAAYAPLCDRVIAAPTPLALAAAAAALARGRLSVRRGR